MFWNSVLVLAAGFRALSVWSLFMVSFMVGTPRMYAWVLKSALAILDIRGAFASKWDQARLHIFYKHMGPGVIVFNHPTWYDFAALMATFGSRIVPRFVAFRWSIPFPLCRMAERMQCLLLDKTHGTGMATQIVRAVQSRRPGQPIVCIAPAGPHSLEDETRLPPFHTSAFLADAPVLPVVLRYQPYHSAWRDDPLSLGAFMWSLMRCRTPIRYRVHVLPPQIRRGDETMEAFKQRVKDEMESVPRMADAPADETETPEPPYQGSYLLLLTSLALAAPGWLALRQTCKAMYGMGMLSTALISSIYHGTGNRHVQVIHVANVYLSAAFYGGLCVLEGYGWPLAALGGIALLRLLFPWRHPISHALLVHLPCIMGCTALAVLRECV